MKARDKYIKEMREYWQATRGTGLLGAKASEPENFEQIIGKYYDEHIAKKEPPLLSVEAMDKAYKIPDTTQTWPYHLRHSIAEAQREADIKFYS